MHPIAALLALQGWEAMTNTRGNAVARHGDIAWLVRHIVTVTGKPAYGFSTVPLTSRRAWTPRCWDDVSEGDLMLMVIALRKAANDAP